MSKLFIILLISFTAVNSYALTAQEVNDQQTKNNINIMISQLQQNQAAINWLNSTNSQINVQIQNAKTNLSLSGINWNGVIPTTGGVNWTAVK